MLSYDIDRRDLNIYPKLSLILCIHRLTPPGSEVWPALDVLSELKPKFLGWFQESQDDHKTCPEDHSVICGFEAIFHGSL